MSRSGAKVILVLPDSSHLDYAINASVCLSELVDLTFFAQ